MIYSIVMPAYESHVKKHEYSWHYGFIRKYAELNSIDVHIAPRNERVYCGNGTYFSMIVNEEQVIIDYSDHELLSFQTDLPCFKYHYSEAMHSGMPNVFPTGPMLDIPSLDRYRAFFELCTKGIYTCNGDTILNCQRAYLGARERRNKVQRMLVSAFGNDADIKVTRDQWLFWNKHSSCLAAVCVPGARNNMIDRGHYEQTALGVCVIAPPVSTTLPFGKRLEPGYHFLECMPDYSDLIEKIRWCRSNRDECRRIGSNARELFRSCCMPDKYWQWINDCLYR